MSNTIAPEVIWQGRYITVLREGQWEYVNRARSIRAAVILAIDDSDPDEQYILLVEQWRVPLHRRCIELPAGLVGDDVAGENPAIAAARELEEETGYRATTWTNVGDFFSSPGMVGESFTLMIARGLERIGPGGGVDGEDIIVHRVALAAIPDFIAERRAVGLAIDVKIALLLSSAWLNPTSNADQRKLSA